MTTVTGTPAAERIPPADLVAGSRYEVCHVSKSFAGTRALVDVSVTFTPGEIHTLIGENGAGKSTLLKILSGVETPDAGQLRLRDVALTSLTPRSAQQLGIYLVPQEPTLMAHLTAAENLFLGTLPRGRIPFTVNWRQMRRTAGDYFAQLGLDIDPDTRAETLSVAQQQLLECARALVHQCTVLFFDEPTSPLTSHEAEILFELMRRLRDRGCTLGFISHRLDEVLELSDRVTVLRDGRVVTQIRRSEATRAGMVQAMVGRAVALERPPTRSIPEAPPVLDVRELSRPGEFSSVTFGVRPGEIVGFAGLVGSGRTEIAETIFGLRRESSGEVLIDGAVASARSPRRCVERGLIYLPEDRARNGIFAEVALSRNVTAAVIDTLPRSRRLLDAAGERQTVARALQRTSVKASSVSASIKTLSGGNQQRAMFARWMLTEPKLAILDEPSRGVDVGAKADIWALVRAIAEGGAGVLVISSELEELVSLCDRVIGVYEGRIVGELAGDAVTLSGLGEIIVGGTGP